MSLLSLKYANRDFAPTLSSKLMFSVSCYIIGPSERSWNDWKAAVFALGSEKTTEKIGIRVGA